jgi:cellulose biosynthesis protein BcsQ
MLGFDNAVDVALSTVRDKQQGRQHRITLVRDPTGQITAVLPNDALNNGEWDELADELHSRLGSYSPGSSRVLLREADLIDAKDVIESEDRVSLGADAWLVDRLLTNQDWLRDSPVKRRLPAVATAFSLKGGVGRSTALSVWAWHLARQGRRVLVVDLDLEAPGIGSLLLDELPDYGLVDWLIEGLAHEPPDPWEDFVIRSPVAQEATGQIEVMPAFGEKTRNYIAKVGRMYLPGVAPDGTEVGLSKRLRKLLDLLAARQGSQLDAVLLDARAGLHDIGAAAVTQLGAEVFIFARDEPQSWEAFRLLFEHLALSRAVKFGMRDDDLRWRLKMVGAQMVKTESAMRRWIDSSYRTWSALYDDEGETQVDETLPAQTFVSDDENAPHFPLPVYAEPGIQGQGLTDPEIRPPWDVVQGAFGRFVDGATARLLDGSLTEPAEIGEETE